MKKMSLIEPNHLAGVRMFRRGLTNLRGAQNVSILPFEFNIRFAAVGLDLRPIDVPAALLWGEAERLLAVDQVRDYQALLPRSTIRTVPGWGHFPMIERPDQYATEIAALARALVERDAA